MKGTRAISFLLVFALMAALVVPGSFVLPAKADTDNGMRISKTATKNTDGTYTITLEAYATGSKVISVEKTDLPADIVLVLDQSGSMDNDMHTYSFREYTNKTNSDYYNLRHNDNGNRGNLYYKLDDGGYASVSVVKSEYSSEDSYEECSGWTNTQYYNYNIRNTLYYKDGDAYKSVTVSATIGYPITYTYDFKDGTPINSEWREAVPDFKGKGPLYYRNTVDNYSYTYSYTDQNGVTHQIGTSEGNDATPGFTLYERYSTGTTTRREALKSAVTTFANSVAEKAKGKDGVLGTDDDVKHRVAVVGFASQSGYGNNTELLSIAGSNSGSVGVAYNSITNQNLIAVLQDMTTEGGQQMVQSAIGALAAQGATEANLGMDMADRILNANPVPNGEKRTRVVVFFTDGSPTTYDGFEMSVANSAISKAGTIKAGGASVYSVGIFEGADATSAGSSSGTDTQKANWFMQNVSSNDGNVQSPSYYLSAADAGTLSNIFQQIASNIESGGTTATLGSTSVVKDIIAPSFQLPQGTTANDITLETYSYVGENTWNKNTDAMGANASIEGGQVSVTGFDFSGNWCGTVTENGNTTYRGNKLEISFKVVPKPGFLGGNDVPTNGDASGVYADASDDSLVKAFAVPTVNVPIATPDFTVNNKTIYEGNSTAVSELYTLPDYNTEENAWKAAYVNVTTTGTTADETVSPTDCTNYDVTVTYEPITDGSKSQASGGGAANATTGVSANKTATVHVLHPVVTAAVHDVEKYYGESYTLGNDAGGSITLDWVDKDTSHANNPAVEGTAPYTKDDLDLEYTTTQFAGQSGTVPKNNFDVTVKVKKGTEEVTGATITTTCGISGSNCATPATDGVYTVHVNTCQLTITKVGGASDEPYVFTVKKDGEKYSEVTVMGGRSETIYELPVGTYSIQEDTDWSWRYTPSYSDSVTLSATNPNGTITCTNSLNKQYWLNGFSNVMQNIFNKAG